MALRHLADGRVRDAGAGVDLAARELTRRAVEDSIPPSMPVGDAGARRQNRARLEGEGARGEGRSRRVLQVRRRTRAIAVAVLSGVLAFHSASAQTVPPRPVRGIYGGVPQEILDSGRRLRDFGVDAVWLGSGSFTPERLARLRAEGIQVYAEFNTLHVVEYVKEHPDAAPIGSDGRISPPPLDWQGICPTHDGYRRFRMDAFRSC